MLLSIRESNFPQEVLDASVPVLVHFWAPWCGLCRLIVPQLHQFQANWQDQVKVVGVNADQSLKLASTYRLQTLPTLILFDQGRELHRLEQFHGRDDLRWTLDKFMQNYQNRCCSVSLSTPEYLALEA